MEVFGVVAAGITLGPILVKLGCKLRSIIRSMRYAGSDIKSLGDELRIYTQLYNEFCEHLAFGHLKNKKAPSSRPSFSLGPLIAWTESAIDGLKRLLRSVEAPADKHDGQSPLQTLKAHIKWYLGKNEVIRLRASLSVARESIIGFTNIWNIEVLKEQVRLLRKQIRNGIRPILPTQPNVKMEDHIKYLEKSIKNRYRMRRENDERLREARAKVESQGHMRQGRDLGLATNKLFEFADSVQQYVDEHSMRRTRSSPRTPRRESPVSPIEIDTSLSGQCTSTSEEAIPDAQPSDSPAQETDTIVVSQCSCGQTYIGAPGQRHTKCHLLNRVSTNGTKGTIPSPPTDKPEPSVTPSDSKTSRSEPGKVDLRKDKRKIDGSKPLAGSTSPSGPPAPQVQDAGAPSKREGVVQIKEHDGQGSRREIEPRVKGKSEEEEVSDDEPSPFQPLPPFHGRRRPKGWRQRRDRNASPEDFW